MNILQECLLIVLKNNDIWRDDEHTCRFKDGDYQDMGTEYKCASRFGQGIISLLSLRQYTDDMAQTKTVSLYLHSAILI
jgi:hypothetical protein